MKKNLFKIFIRNVNASPFDLLTISSNGFFIKTARINDVKPFEFNAITTAKEEITL